MNHFRIIAGLSLFMLPLLAFGQVNIYLNPSNLQVLPEDTSSDILRATMRSFALDTGFRCSSCHVGEEGQPLTEYDFASDEKDLKKSARLMMKMVNAINSKHLAELGDDRVQVRCVTCHRGVNKPELIADVLGPAADEGGVEAMLARYTELRERYYGSHAYDFSAVSLSDCARSRATDGKLDEATAMLDRVLEDQPGSFMTHFAYGEILHRAGDAAGAIGHYEKATGVNAGAAGFLQQRIDRLREAAAREE